MSDAVFTGSIPKQYETLLVPLIFAPYAKDLAARVRDFHPQSVLELAAGTGALTRRLAKALAPETSIVATDLNEAMLAQAIDIGADRPITWMQADAMALPFADHSFDAVVCQFGVMFFPDKGRAFAEMRRVLRPGGVLVFNVWDRIETNEFAHTVTQALAAAFPDNAPEFMARTPHGYHDVSAIAADLKAGGFAGEARFVTLSARAAASSPRVPAMAYCQGTPLRTEIAARGMALDDATDLTADALEQRFGPGPVDSLIQAIIVSVRA